MTGVMFLFVVVSAASLLWLFAYRDLKSIAVAEVAEDQIRFDLITGRLVGIGARIAYRLGYGSPAEGRERFKASLHFRNASLTQLVSGLIPVSDLVIQDLTEQPLSGALKLSLSRTGDVINLEVRNFERRENELTIAPESSRPSGLVSKHEDFESLLRLCEEAQGDGVNQGFAAFVSMPQAALYLSLAFNARLGLKDQAKWIPKQNWLPLFDPASIATFESACSGTFADQSKSVVMASATGERLVFAVATHPLPARYHDESFVDVGSNVPGQRVQILLFRTQKKSVPFVAFDDKARSSLMADSSGLTTLSWASESLEDAQLTIHDLPNRATKARAPTGDRSGTISGRSQRLAPQVLLVEDDPLITRMLSAKLLEFEIDLEVASSVEGALAHCERSLPFDLVITDLNLSDGKAIPLLDHLTASELKPNIVLVSAESVKHPGIDSVLAKPFKMAQFEALLDIYFGTQGKASKPDPSNPVGANR